MIEIQDRIYDSRDELKSKIKDLIEGKINTIQIPLQPLKTIIEELAKYEFCGITDYTVYDIQNIRFYFEYRSNDIIYTSNIYLEMNLISSDYITLTR
jgi:hypothetical protein